MQRLDIVLVGALAGAAPAAIYAASTRFIVVGQMSNNAISMAAQPSLATSLARGDRSQTNHIYQVSTAWLIALSWPLYLVLVLFGTTALRAFGDGYASGGSVLLLLSIAMLVATGFGMVDVLLAMAGHTSWNLANAVLALAIQVVVDVALIPSWGIVGAAVGWAAAIVVRNSLALVQVRLALRLHPFGPATALSAALSLACFAVLPGLTRLIIGDGIGSLVLGGVLGAMCYAVGLWRWRGLLELRSLRRR